MSTKIQFTTIALAAALVFAGGAKAAPASMTGLDDVTTSVRVSLADLDLNQQAGMAVAHQRIRQAATFVCGSEPPYAGLYQHRLYNSCRKAAVDEAMADLSAQVAALGDSGSTPKLTALAANR
ncbi:MAG: UrcA family protein [Phenylobacterium sp.]|jgi:UrcA family protein